MQAEMISPTLGAVVVNYNYAHYVRDAIESLLKQDSAFDEIVVVDDGSTDHSMEVIREYQTQVRIVQKVNGGQLDAFIRGAQELGTDYFYVLDADDYAAPELVRTVKPLLDGNCVKLQFQLRGVDAEKNPLQTVFPTYAEKYGARQMQEDNRILGFYVCPPTSGNIFRRDVFTSLNFAAIDRRDFVDGPPVLAMPALGEVRSLNRPLAHYRVHGSGHSRWDRPTPALLDGEVAWFGRRWVDTCKLLGVAEPPFGKSEPLYVLERKLMCAALQSGGRVWPHVGPFVRRLVGAHLSLKQRWMLAGWALALLVPSASLRRKLVLARRSPLNRSRVLKRLVGFINRSRNARASGSNAAAATHASP